MLLSGEELFHFLLLKQLLDALKKVIEHGVELAAKEHRELFLSGDVASF